MSKQNEIKYYVIGGQYEALNYGGVATLLGAKRMAGKNKELWDNWQGWHTPAVYAAADCEERTTMYGRIDILPKVNAEPVSVYKDGAWTI